MTTPSGPGRSSLPEPTAQRSFPVVSCPVQYSSGSTQVDLGQGFTTGRAFFHLEERTSHPEVNAFFADRDFPTVMINHMRTGEPSEQKRHYYLGETIGFLPFTEGPVRHSQIESRTTYAQATALAGIGVKRKEPDLSHLAIRGLLIVATPKGNAVLVPHLAQLGVRGKLTDNLWKALVEHLLLCKKADQVLKRTVNCFELRLPLRVAASSYQVGPTMIRPFVCGHPEQPDEQYINRLVAPPQVVALVHQHWQGVQNWALDFNGLPPRTPEK